MCLHVSCSQPLTSHSWEKEMEKVMVMGIHTFPQSRLAVVELATVACVLLAANVFDTA